MNFNFKWYIHEFNFKLAHTDFKIIKILYIQLNWTESFSFDSSLDCTKISNLKLVLLNTQVGSPSNRVTQKTERELMSFDNINLLPMNREHFSYPGFALVEEF